jgi:hypothetical protein
MLNRRSFVAFAGGLVVAARVGRASEPKKRIAFIGTEVRQHSHAQHFLDRHTLGYAWGGKWIDPRIDVASVFLAQYPEQDLGRERIRKHGLKSYPTIAEALTEGGSQLSVDGVVIIAEHGKYPVNEKGQTLYPRYEFFKEVVKIFEASGRSVPVFNDKHLSTDWGQCVEMVNDSRRLQFPFLAGSSLPVTRRMPAIDMPYDTPLKESVCVAYGGVDSYDFHALETTQCMSERRQGGEVGIVNIRALRGAAMWEYLDQDARKETRDLMVASLTRSHNLPVEGGYPTERVTYDWAKRSMPEAIGYFIEHRDGFRTSIFLTKNRDFNYAGLRSDNGEIISCQMYLPMPGHGSTTADFFNPLVRHIETLVMEERSPYPIERTLLTSGMVIGGVDSLHAGGKLIETPDMKIEYKAPSESLFWNV